MDAAEPLNRHIYFAALYELMRRTTTPHSSLLTPHSSLLTPHFSPFPATCYPPLRFTIYIFFISPYTVYIFHKETRKPFLSAGAGKKGFVVSKGDGAAFRDGVRLLLVRG
jgi:hypothetical protein